MRLKHGVQALLLGCALVLLWGVSAASAFELPDVVALPSEEKPIVASGSTKALNFFETEIGEKITDEEVKVELKITPLSSAGTGTVDLIGVKKGKSPCQSTGDAEGVVLIKGEFHLVFTTRKAPLEVGALLSFEPFAVTCGTIKVKMSGELIGHVSAEFNRDIVELGLTFHCSGVGKGKQELSSYFNDEEKEVQKQLLVSNFGLGNENGCKNISEEVKGKSSVMAEIRT
jgi:hypothetical protein